MTRKCADFRMVLNYDQPRTPMKEARRIGVARNPVRLTRPQMERMDWHSIHWRQTHREVNRLQARIVKATQQGNRRKVRALQHILTRSLAGAAIAVKRVTENQGKKTPGIDGETWNTPQKKLNAVHRIRQGQYKASPLRRIYIPKANGKKRPLGIPTLLDRGKQALHLLSLDPIAECLADPNSYGFRRERSTADAIQKCFMLLCLKQAFTWILEGDIKSCFDKLDHAWLLRNISMNKKILNQWLKAGFIDKNAFYETQEGTPQGGIASPVLANMALDGLEKELDRAFKGTVKMVRYADDFILTGKTKELLEEKVKPLVEKFMAERGLELSQEKTRITSIEKGFDFLGQNIRKYGGKLLIKPSKKSIKSLLGKVSQVIKENRQAKTTTLIRKLNPILRGWANYHRHVVSKDIFSKIDHEVWQKTWRWAKGVIQTSA